MPVPRPDDHGTPPGDDTTGFGHQPAGPGQRPAGTEPPGAPDGYPGEPEQPARSGPPAAGPRHRTRAGRAWIVVALLFSLLALAVSAAGGWFSWQALRIVALSAQPAGSPVTGEPARPPEPARYPVSYAKEPLRLLVPCAGVLHLDLDEPRAGTAEVLADLRYDGGCGDRSPRLSLGVGAAGASREVTADADATDCDRAIRTAPLGRGLPVDVKPGAALCVLTAAVPAALVLVEIIDVGGSGTAGLRATSWRVPEGR